MRYFLGQDNSNRWFLIPVENRQEWLDWVYQLSQENANYYIPSYAVPLGNALAYLSFTDPQEEE